MIQIKKIEKKVPNKVILKGVTCEIKQGLTFILGDSGAGKSTILNIIGMLDNFDNGNIVYSNSEENISYKELSKKEKEEFISTHIGFIFQDANLIDSLGACDNVAIGLELSGQKADREEINKNLHKLGIEDTDKSVQFLSGGEKQRVAIARAIEKNADIILADEPTGNLDSENAETVFKLLKEISKDKTVIVVTHNSEKAKEYGDNIIKIKDGYVENIDTQIQKNESIQKPKIKSDKSIKFGFIKKLSKKNIKKFKRKYISIIAVMSIAIAGAISMMTMKYCVDNKIDEMNYAYYDADIVEVEYSSAADSIKDMVMGYDGVPISDDDLEYISDISDFTEVVPTMKTSLYCEGYVGSFKYRLIKLNDFFEQRTMLNDIEGSFPLKTSDIIIGKDIAESLSLSIGDTVVIEDFYNNEYNMTVCGINNSKNVDGNYLTYIDYENFKTTNILYNCTYLTKESMFDEEDRITYTSSSSGFIEKDMPTNGVIYGDDNPKENEIVVSVDIFSELCNDTFGGYNAFKEEDFNNPEEIMDEITAVFNEQYYLSANDAYLVKVVGVHNGGSTTIYVNDDWYNEISLLKPTVIQCYTKNLDTAKKFDSTNYSEKFQYNSYYQERFSSAVENNRIWKVLFLFASLIAVILVVVQINSYTRISITEKTYEVGIIKSLGGSKKYIIYTLMWDQLNITFKSCIIATVLYAIVMIVMKFKGYVISGIINILLTVIISYIVILLLCIISTFFKINELTKSNPIDDIRKRI